MKRTALVSAIVCLLFTSSTFGEDLLQVYQLALQYDAQYRAARGERDATFENRPIAESRLLPELGIFGNLERVHEDVRDTPGSASGEDQDQAYGSRFLSLELSQALYRRDYWYQLEQADRQVARAEADFQAAGQDLIIRTAQAYFDVLSAQDELEFAEAEKKAVGRQLDQAKQRFEVGLIAVTDVYEAQAAFDQSRANVIQGQNAVSTAWEALYEIISENVAELAPLKETIPLDPPDPADIDVWRDLAQQNNLSIRSATFQREIARNEIEIQRSGHYPDLDIVGSYEYARNERLNNLDTNTGRIGVQLNMPLYTGGGVSARTRQAGFNLEAAQDRLDGERRAVVRQVRDAYRGVMDTISGLEALRAGVVSAEGSLEATTAGFEVGTRTIIDVLGSERDLFLARSRYATTRYTYILQGLLLKQAEGSLSVEDLKQVNSLLQK